MIDVILVLLFAVAVTLLLAAYPVAILWLAGAGFVAAPLLLRWWKNQR